MEYIQAVTLEGFKLSTEAVFGLWRVRDDDSNHQSGFSWFGNSRTRCTVAIFWRARSAVDTAATEHATSPRWSRWTWRRTEAVQSLFGARAHAGQQHQIIYSAMHYGTMVQLYVGSALLFQRCVFHRSPMFFVQGAYGTPTVLT